MDKSRIERRFDNIESLIDLVYGAVDTFFLGVDWLFTATKNFALERSDSLGMTVQDKAHAIADYYENNGNERKAALIRKQIEAGMYDVKRVEELWDGIQPPQA